VQLKHTTAAYIREISIGEWRVFFAERCNSVGRGYKKRRVILFGVLSLLLAHILCTGGIPSITTT